MTVIKIPPEIEVHLVEEARKRGITPEALALESLHRSFVSTAPKGDPGNVGSLFEYLSGYIGTVDGASEAFSEKCGKQSTV